MVEKQKKTEHKFNSPYNYKKGPWSYEKENTEPSKTIPNQGLTVQELVRLHTQGISLSIFKEGLFEMEDFNDEVNPMRKQNFDLSDLDEIRAELESAHTEIYKLREERQKQAAIKRKEEIIEEYKETIKKEQQIRAKTPKEVLKETITKKKEE